MAERLVPYEGFPDGVDDSFVEHAVKAPSQYDNTCRALAAEVIRLRAELRRASSGEEKKAFTRGAATALSMIHKHGVRDSAGVRSVANELGITISHCKRSGITPFDWCELKKAGVQ